MNATVTQVKTTDNMAGLIRHDAHYFCARTIDGQRALLEQSYRLRYQVYCLERKFLRAEDYPNGLEIDEFDRHAAHIGAIDSHGELAGTARVVRASEQGLPIFEHCVIFPYETEFTPGEPATGRGRPPVGEPQLSPPPQRHGGGRRERRCAPAELDLPGTIAGASTKTSS